MTTFALHRVNSIAQLEGVTPLHGAEIDLRLHHGKLVLAHDPLQEGCEFKEWLPRFLGSLLILNVKEAGLEEMILADLANFDRPVEYFFLDQALPYLIKNAKKGVPCSARVSEYETLESACLLQTEWLWVDSFTGNWDHLEQIATLLSSSPIKKKICLVSPELQNRVVNLDAEIKQVSTQLKVFNMSVDVICTKFPSRRESEIS